MAKAKKAETILTLEEKLEQVLIADWEQPYKVPENWCWTELQQLCSIPITDGTHKTPKYCDAGNGIPFISAKDVTGQYINWENIKYITKELHEELYKRLAPQINDILLAKNGTTGVAAIVDTKKIFDIYVTLALLRINSNIAVPKYVLHLINSPVCKKQFDEHLTGIGVPNLHLRDIKVTQIPLPPLAEQKRIVDRIERMFSKLDEATANVQTVIDGFENRKSAILHKAFNGELTAKWREESEINIAGWESLTLNDVGEYKKGPFGSSITKSMFVTKAKNTYKVYEQGNAIRKTLEYGQYYISKEKYEELKGFAIKGGDIIISCAGTIGEVYKLPDNCEAGIINQALMRVRLFENIDEDFFINYFGEILKGDINNKSKGTAIKNIPPFKVMKAMPIQSPSLSEQKEIVIILNGLLFKEQVAKEKAEEVLERIELIKKSILTRAFRGELGTNNPEEESSVELLKEILSKDAEIIKKVKSERIVIPKHISNKLTTELEKKLIKIFIKKEETSISISDLMPVSSKKFEIMDSLRNLEKKGVIVKETSGNYILKR